MTKLKSLLRCWYLNYLFDETMEEKQLKEQMIADVMDDFDFVKVHKAMLATDWRFIIASGESVVPDLWRIICRAKEILYSVMKYYGNKESHSISANGFTASIDEEGNLSLQFILENMTVFSDEYDEI